MKIGDIFVLTNTAPYHHLTGHNSKEPKFIQVKIIEEKYPDAAAIAAGHDSVGYLAKGSDWYIYGFRYPHEYTGFGDPSWIRYCPNEEFAKLSNDEKNKLCSDLVWHDVVKFQCPGKPIFADKFDRKIEFCEKHQLIHYTDGHCFYCKRIPDHTRKVIMNLEEHKFIGWY